MKRSYIKNLFNIFAIIFFIHCVSIFPQGQSGKISGTVFDASTNEPLIGANILIEGTNIGAATNIDGKFVILNISPGNYNIIASMIGYSKTTLKNVEVYIDRTTQLSFGLNNEALQMEQVVVVATKPPVIKDQTATAQHIDDKQIKVAPIEGLRGALELGAGFQKDQKGNFSVRGSGANELNFQINGVEQMSSNTSAPGTFGSEKADNSWKYDVNPLGVQQLQLITGGFSAEYGNAQAGVVKVVLKEGAPRLTGEFRIEYRPSGQYHYGDYIYSKNNWEWQKWGTIDKWIEKKDQILRELTFENRYEWLKNSNPELYNQLADEEIKWAYDLWIKNHEPSDENILGVYDYRQYSYQRYLFGFGGPLGKDPNLLKFYFSGEYKRNPSRLPTPEKVQVGQNYILNITYQPGNGHKLKVMGSYQSYIGGIWSGSSDIRWSGLAYTPPGVSTKYIVTLDPVREEQTIAQTFNWVYAISPESFTELTLTHQQEKYELPYKYLAGYGVEVDRADSSKDPSGTVLRDGSWWEKDLFRAPFGFSTNYYQDSRTENFGLKFDYTNQITFNQLIKTGIQMQYWDMFNNGVNSSYQANSFIARNGFADSYYAYPISLGFYLQDRFEFEGIIANVGLRAEAYNYQTQIPEDPFNYLYPGTEGTGVTGNPNTVPSETKYTLLPRLGVSFPIGESTAFRIQYGHFASMPIFSEVLSKRTASGWSGLADGNLKSKKTITYEFGLQQQLSDIHRLDLVLYFNDRFDQTGTIQLASATGSRTSGAPIFDENNNPLYFINSFTNNRFGSTFGFETIFETFAFKEWSYRLSYSISQTTSGNFGSNIKLPGNTRDLSTRSVAKEVLASWDRTHNFRALVQYFIDSESGFEIFGFKPFSNSVFSLTYTAQSGLPFTYITDFDLIDVPNNRRYPLESMVDFSFNKDILLDNIKIVLGIRIMNLFDNKWLTPFSTGDDVNQWIEKGITMDMPGNNPTRFSYLVAPYRAYLNIPRQIFFTIGVGF